MKNSPNHTFHIPVMGLAFTIDSPIKVARFGISSVISIAEDRLIEMMRKHYSQEAGFDYVPIESHESDYRARRIEAYLNLVGSIVAKQVEKLRLEPFGLGKEIDRYFEMLPEKNPSQALYLRMLETENLCDKIHLQDELRKAIVPGSIDVNIMTKLDKSNPNSAGEILDENSDAVAALRGYSNSRLADSSIVFSAGLNPRLFAYLEHCPDFKADETGTTKKKIIIKVTDFRSALIQGKYVAKKGLWVSEFRIESGLNCGGHAFATDGYLLGPVLEEFKLRRAELYEAISTLMPGDTPMPAFKISVQGGIGTHEEDNFLRENYEVDSTGWGTPFLLVPEATTVDEETMQVLAAAKEGDVILSKSSPLGVRFNYLKGTSGHIERNLRILSGKSGSPCTEKHLAFNTEFTKEPICTASKKYQKLKLADLQKAELSETERLQAREDVLAKECLCVGLSNSAAIRYKELFVKKLHAVTMCPGPNIVNFSQIVSLKTMIDHIYGRIQSLTKSSRPHMFIAELNLYVDYLKESLLEESTLAAFEKRKKYFGQFFENLFQGIAYYGTMADQVSQSAQKQFKMALQEAELELGLLKEQYLLVTG